MKNNRYIAILIIFLSFNCFPQDRWRFVGSSMWDTKTAKKIDSKRVKFFYEYIFTEEQRQYGIKAGIYTKKFASEIKYGRTGVVVNCIGQNFGIFSSVELNSQKNAMMPTFINPIEKIEMNSIEPETAMEDLMIDVCTHFKLKK